MREFDYDEWSAQKGEKEIICQDRERLVIKVSCSKPCSLFGLQEGTWIPIEVGGSFKVKLRSEGWEKFKVKGPDSSTMFGMCVRTIPVPAEPVDPTMAPVIEPRAPDNLVQALKLQMMGQRGFVRRPDPDDMPSMYEVLDDDYDFEEELIEARRAAQRAGDDEITSLATPPPDEEDPPSDELPDAAE